MKTAPRISLKNAEEIDILRQAGKILAGIIKDVSRQVKPGMTTQDIDCVAEDYIRQQHVVPAFKGYRGFPGCACTSVNEEVVHGIPGSTVVKDGDIVSIDIGIIHQKYYSDTAVTVAVGNISPELQNLLHVTEASLLKGIEQAIVGNHLSDISHAIQGYVEKYDLAIVREFVGHGIGKNLHEDPEIPNFGEPGQGPVLKEGMVLAIEPMVNIGTWKTRVMDDGWTVVTEDGQASAHFEHSIVITTNGPEILTR